MKIVFLVSSLNAGGAERVATILCNAWAERGDEVTLIPTYSGGGLPFYVVSEKVKLTYLSSTSESKHIFNQIKRLLRLRRMIKQCRADVVISFLPNVNVAALLATRGLNIPIICCERRTPSTFPLSFGWELLCKLTYRFADMLTGQTEQTVNELAKFYPGCKRLSVIPNPMSNEIFSIEKQAHQTKTVLSLCRLEPFKQIDILVSIFADIASDYPDWTLAIYGDGPEYTRLQQHIKRLAMEKQICLYGKTDQAWKIMASADIYCMTSASEGFPNTLLEAMAIGLPCVVFDCKSGPAEISLQGKCAKLIPLNDKNAYKQALIELMQNDNERQRLGRTAKESIQQHYTLTKVLALWDGFFKEIGAIR